MSIWTPRLLSVLRIVAALIFMEHGLMKLFHFPAAQPGAPDPLPAMLMVAAIIEVVGGALLTRGLLTRVAAFICSGEMAVAYFIGHFPSSPWPAISGGDAAILYCFIFLYLAFAGGGQWSADAVLAKRRGTAV